MRNEEDLLNICKQIYAVKCLLDEINKLKNWFKNLQIVNLFISNLDYAMNINI